MIDFNKRIAIADYKWKFSIYALICWFLAIIGILRSTAVNNHWQLFIIITLFFTLASTLTAMLLHPKFIFIGKKGPTYYEFLRFKHKKLLDLKGGFAYFFGGFIYKENGIQTIEKKWTDIQQISVKLIETVTADQILELNILFSDKSILIIDETTEGWVQFVKKLTVNVKKLPITWEEDFILSKDSSKVIYNQ